jgi:hypothetical protein
MANQMLLEKQLFTEIEWSCIISSWTEKKKENKICSVISQAMMTCRLFLYITFILKKFIEIGRWSIESSITITSTAIPMKRITTSIYKRIRADIPSAHQKSTP